MMMFTVGNIPSLDEMRSKQGDEFLQHVLVKTLLKVATKYKTAYLATVFTESFLHTLIQLALVADPQVRLGTQKIFHTLLDRWIVLNLRILLKLNLRHDNLPILKHMQYVLDVSDVQLTVEKCSRADQMFIRKNIHDITQMLYRFAKYASKHECYIFRATTLVAENHYMHKHMDSILCTMNLLCIEVGSEEVLFFCSKCF